MLKILILLKSTFTKLHKRKIIRVVQHINEVSIDWETNIFFPAASEKTHYWQKDFSNVGNITTNFTRLFLWPLKHFNINVNKAHLYTCIIVSICQYFYSYSLWVLGKTFFGSCSFLLVFPQKKDNFHILPTHTHDLQFIESNILWLQWPQQLKLPLICFFYHTSK